MRDLVALAEKREAACKDEISTLLASRSTMYEAAPARPACLAAPPAPAEEQEEEAEDDGCGETVEAAAAKIDEAEKRIEVAQVQHLRQGRSSERAMRFWMQEARLHMVLSVEEYRDILLAGRSRSSVGQFLGLILIVCLAAPAGSVQQAEGCLCGSRAGHALPGAASEPGAGSSHPDHRTLSTNHSRARRTALCRAAGWQSQRQADVSRGAQQHERQSWC